MLQLCRTCHGEITTGNCVAINDNNVKSSSVKSQLLLCVPELQQDLIKDPVLCATCADALHAAYTFKAQCLQVEERIRKYFRDINLITKNLTFVELYTQFTRVSAPCNSLEQENSVVKSSNGIAGNDTEEDDFVVKQDVLHIKEEDVYEPNEDKITDLKHFSSNIGNVDGKDFCNVLVYNVHENEDIVKVEHDITENNFKEDVKVEDDLTENNFKEDIVKVEHDLTENNFKQELEKLSLLKLLDEPLQSTQKQCKSSEKLEDLPQSPARNAPTGPNNRYGTAKAAESPINKNKREYLQKKRLVSNIITFANLENGKKEIQTSEIQLKQLLTNECFVSLVKIEDLSQSPSGNFFKTTSTRTDSKSKHQCTNTETKSTINSKEQERLVTEKLASNVVGIRSNKKFFQCNICDIRTARKSRLVIHMRTHTGEKPFQCTTCEYRATQKYDLIVHLRKHTGEKPLHCRYCEFCAASHSSLSVHMRTHTGEKPFQCIVCEFCTARHSSFLIHMRTHTGEKPFQCNICEFCTAKHSNLSRHMKTHIGEKQLHCSICKFRTASRTNLSRHIKTHAGAKPYQCSSCEYCTAISSNFSRHLRTHVAKNPVPV